jgi:hypothetical protein
VSVVFGAAGGQASALAPQRVALLIASCVLAGGCGSSSAHSQSTQDFASEYRAASERYREQLATVQARARNAQDPNAKVEVFRDILDVTNAALHRFEKLHAPSNVSNTYGQFVAALRDQASSLRRILTAVNKNDNGAVNSAVLDLSTALQRGLTLQRQLDQAVTANTPTSG